ANDLQQYAAVLTEARLLPFSAEEITQLQQRSAELNRHATDGFFTTHYADKYFSRENCQRIDAIRQLLDVLLLPSAQRTFLLASLLSSADAVANTASVYGAFLKKLKERALQPLTLAALPAPNQPTTYFRVTTENIETLSLAVALDVLYLD